MRNVPLALLSTVLVLGGVLLLPAVVHPSCASAHPKLETVLPDSECSTLHHLHGKALWKHWIRHLRPQEYQRICDTVTGESRWRPGAQNASGAAGLVQFMPGWYNGAWFPWRFDPHDPVLSLRVMVYILEHPTRYGGWSNWAGH